MSQPESVPPAPTPVVQPMVVVCAPPVGPSPMLLTCPNCKEDVLTTTTQTSNQNATIACIVLAVIGCWPCCCIPFCLDGFQMTEHKCPKCHALVGVHNQ
ncbi:Hypothetical predicted protein [Cloeon dipterum]|nr:Hypothetical predicted protein [Cloeon dipterum]